MTIRLKGCGHAVYQLGCINCAQAAKDVVPNGAPIAAEISEVLQRHLQRHVVSTDNRYWPLYTCRARRAMLFRIDMGVGIKRKWYRIIGVWPDLRKLSVIDTKGHTRYIPVEDVLAWCDEMAMAEYEQAKSAEKERKMWQWLVYLTENIETLAQRAARQRRLP